MKSQENADSGSRWANKHHQALANTVRGCIKVAPVITILKAKKGTSFSVGVGCVRQSVRITPISTHVRRTNYSGNLG